MRIAVITALFMLSLYPWSARADAAAGTYQVEFRVEAPGAKTPLISGNVEAEPNETMKFKSNLTGSVSHLGLELFVRPLQDGTVGVELEVSENDADGHAISWKPALAGKRGVPLTATIHAGDVTRTVVVTVK